MNFETHVSLLPNIFYPRVINGKEYFFYPIRSLLPSDKFFAVLYAPTLDVVTNFSVLAVGHDVPPETSADIIGFLFRSNLPVANYRTALMSYARSWQQNTTKVSVISDELTLAFKDPHFLLFHAPGKATLVTSLALSDNLHDYLTMI